MRKFLLVVLCIVCGFISLLGSCIAFSISTVSGEVDNVEQSEIPQEEIKVVEEDAEILQEETKVIEEDTEDPYEDYIILGTEAEEEVAWYLKITERNIENIDIMKDYIPDFDSITSMEIDGTHTAKVYCNNNLKYYVWFFLKDNSHDELIYIIQTTEEDYNSRTYLYKAEV